MASPPRTYPKSQRPPVGVCSPPGPISLPSNVQLPTNCPNSSSPVSRGTPASSGSAMGVLMKPTLTGAAAPGCQDLAHLRGRHAVAVTEPLGQMAVAGEPQVGRYPGQVVLTGLDPVQRSGQAQPG